MNKNVIQLQNDMERKPSKERTGDLEKS